MISKLSREFFVRNCLTVSQELLGKIVVHEFDNDTVSGRITEVEVFEVKDIIQTTRVGISKAKDFLNRFYIKNSKYISKKIAINSKL